jgi:hypothetical protein
MHTLDGTEHAWKSSCAVHDHQSGGVLSIGSSQVLVTKEVNDNFHKMLQEFYDCALSHPDIIIQEIHRDAIRNHTKGTNYLLNGRGAKNTRCIGLLTAS